MRVLVTGANGFIGKALCGRLLTHLGTSADILATDIVPGFSWCVPWDVRSDREMPFERVRDLRITHAVHLAAIAAPNHAAKDPSLAWETNVRGMYNVLQLCRLADVQRVVFASSAHVYGISPKYLPTDETHPLSLMDPYTVTKIMGEKMLRLFNDNYGLSSAALRFFNVYGPGQSDDYLIGNKLKEASLSKIVLRSAKVTKDWVHVSDAVRAIVLALESDYVGPVNIGTGVETSIQTIVETIAKATGSDIREDASKDGGPTRMCADIRRAKRVLGWEPIVTVERGLQELTEKWGNR